MTNLNDYFDRARRETPPLQKDEVSNILAEKLSERRDREDAHPRGNGVWWRNVGRVFLTLPLKGWIMISVLLTSAIIGSLLLWQPTPRGLQNGAFNSQALHTAPSSSQPAAMTSVQQKKLGTTSRIVANHPVTIQTPKPEATTIIGTPTVADSIPSPYDSVKVDTKASLVIAPQQIAYPEIAKKLGLEGKVLLYLLIMPDGSVSPRSFVGYSDAALFDSSAMQAFRAATWKPAVRDGKAVPFWIKMPVLFSLNKPLSTNAVMKAQMLTLTDEELKKIGVEQDTVGIATILGWNKARTEIYEMSASIHSQITPNLMGDRDSLFKEFVANLRRQGKYDRAAEWERIQEEHGKRRLRGLLSDSGFKSRASIVSFIHPKEVAKAAYYIQAREIARHLSLPRLVTDGHNYRYFVDISDLPRLQRWRASQKEADEFKRKAKLMNIDSVQIMDSVRKMLIRVQDQEGVMRKARQEAKTDYQQIQDSINKLFAHIKDTTATKISTSKDRKDLTRLSERLSEAKRQEETQFEQEKSDISKLIGIRVACKTARSERDEYLLWYDPTPEFIALLPERYRTGLEREVAAAKKYATKCEIPTEEERKAIPGYFDSWRSCDGVLKIASIFPNPANINATVRFTLAEARSVTITVHNLNGDRLAILEPTPVLPAGEHELPLDFTGRNIGVYLLALTTDKNETAIKRVIISR